MQHYHIVACLRIWAHRVELRRKISHVCTSVSVIPVPYSWRLSDDLNNIKYNRITYFPEENDTVLEQSSLKLTPFSPSALHFPPSPLSTLPSLLLPLPFFLLHSIAYRSVRTRRRLPPRSPNICGDVVWRKKAISLACLWFQFRYYRDEHK